MADYILPRTAVEQKADQRRVVQLLALHQLRQLEQVDVELGVVHLRQALHGVVFETPEDPFGVQSVSIYIIGKLETMHD